MSKSPNLSVIKLAAAVIAAAAVMGAAPIEHSALSPYTVKNYPAIWQRWGAAGVRRIERARAGAAQIMARDPKCDQVAAVDLADLQSIPPDVIVLFAVCENMYRLKHISEADALAALPAPKR